MKTHTIKTPTAELMIVELPRVCDFDLYHDKIYIYDHEAKEGKSIDGSYTLLGKPDEVKEEDAMELVEAPEPYWEDNKNQKVIGNAEWSYTKSLLSLLESKIYWENPYDKSGMTFANEYENKWQEAEKKTFDRNRSLIFKKE